MAMVFDIETNGFLPEVSTIWCLVMQDTDTKEVFKFSDYDSSLPSLDEGLAFLSKQKIVVGHNIIGYDLAVLKHLKDFELPWNTITYDTWLMSVLMNYKRKGGHSLDAWGKVKGKHKIEFSEFDKYSNEMLTYCVGDVELNTIVYEDLVAEAKKFIQKNPLFKRGLLNEMKFARLEAEIRLKGWLFNMDAAHTLLNSLSSRMQEIENDIEPRIGKVLIKVDKETEFKTPKWRADGFYSAITSKYFNIEPSSGRDEDNRLVDGPYCRIEFEQGNISSDKVLKSWLFSIGWEPDEWNKERVNGVWITKGPKLTETSLEKLGDIGKSISEYNTLKSRKGILTGWIEEASRDGRLHGKMWCIGTPSFRCRHEVVANLPSVALDKEGNIIKGLAGGYGYDMRSLLVCEDDHVIVGADSSGNQMRGLCHYINNEEFTNEVINGDVHQKNADILSQVYSTPRKLAKPWLYAYLFGAGAPKLGSILTGTANKQVGEKSAKLFESSIPGLAQLKEQLNNQFRRTADMFGEGFSFIRGLDGRLIFVGSSHQTLNYQLQTTEAITCKGAAVYLKEKLIDLAIPHYFAMHYHDEMAVVVPKEYGEIVKTLSIEAFTEAPKQFGITCMSGDAHIGTNYAEVH